jgi:class 3 adenylate cyclase/tetratricopeptide (TPR) repeat protein
LLFHCIDASIICVTQNPKGRVVFTIAEWLASLGMVEYTERFVENRIDLSVLRDLTDQDLKDLGVVLGDRRKMLRAIAGGRGIASAGSGPGSVADPGPQDIAERRQLTVMFCDLVGSTALSTRLDPEDLRDIIGAYHRHCSEVIVKHGGFVARYMGDGVLAYFGYPQAHEDDAERAVRAGLALVGSAKELGAGSGTALQMRLGIATGLVVVGDLIADDPSHEYEVIGETPNLAARLQGVAEPDAVVIDGNTRRLLGHLFEYRPLGPLSVKGFDAPVAVWQVTQVGAVDSRFEALRTTTTPLIGRNEEIDLIARRWEQVKRGEGCVVLLSGEPGIGKSRIAQTILERLSGEAHTRLRYFCSPHHQDSALYPSITQLERAAGFRRDDSGERRLDKLEAVVMQGTNDLSDAMPLLADLLSIPTGDRYPALNLSPQKRKEKMLQMQVAHVEGLAARQPVLMVYEDVHWSDPTTRESLDLLIDRVPALRVLVIITFRPEFASPWIGHPCVTLLSLSRLPPRRRAEMIEQVSGGKLLPREVTDQIIDRTDGVPLFIEELTKAVVESGLLGETTGRHAVTGPLAIPTSLQASLLARLDYLASTREVVQIAAALGRQFSHDLISAVAMMPKQQLDDALAQLVHAELMFRRGTPPDAEYTFKHVLVQDAAYGTLVRGRRQRLHARIAATLEQHFPEIVVAQPALLAQHCVEAGLAEKAVGYWLKAGQQALVRSATAEGSAQLQKGLDVLAALPDGPWRRQQELDLQIALRPALALTKGYAAPEVGKTIARARELAEQIDRPEHLVSLLRAQWAYHLIRSEPKQALSIAEQMEKIGAAQNDVAARLQGRRAKGVTCFYLGEFVAARSLLEQCHGLGDPAHRAGAGITDPYATMLAHLAFTLAYLGYIDQARSRLNEAMSEARRLRHAQTLADVLIQAIGVGWVTCSPDVQLYAEKLLALSTEQGFPLSLSWALAGRGWSLTTLGQAEEGLTLLTRALASLRETGSVVATQYLLIKLAEAYDSLGRALEGLDCLAEAEQIIEATEERRDDADLHRVRGDLLIAIGDGAAAEKSYNRALAVAERQSAKLLELRVARSLARHWRDQGRRTEAGALLTSIYGWFTEGFDAPVLKDAKALLDELQ